MKKNVIKLEYDKLKCLKGRKKAEYLWCYYKFVLVIIFVVMLVVYSGITIYASARTNPLLSLAIVDVRKDKTDIMNDLKAEFLNALNGERNDAVIIDMNATSLSDENANMKLTVVLSPISENDAVICNKEVYEKFRKEGAFAYWKDILGTEYYKYESYIVDGAFDLSKSEKWNAQEIVDYEPVYFVVLAEAVNPEAAKVVIEYYYN